MWDNSSPLPSPFGFTHSNVKCWLLSFFPVGALKSKFLGDVVIQKFCADSSGLHCSSNQKGIILARAFSDLFPKTAEDIAKQLASLSAGQVIL